MRIHAPIPLDIRVTSYSPPEHITNGNWSAPEVEFTVHTLTGHELSESDFDSDSWSNLHLIVLYEINAEAAFASEALAADRAEDFWP